MLFHKIDGSNVTPWFKKTVCWFTVNWTFGWPVQVGGRNIL